MRSLGVALALSLPLSAGAALFACGHSASNAGGQSSSTLDGSAAVQGSGTLDATAGGTSCPSCVTDNDCAGARCVLFGGDAYCAPSCAADGTCASDRACITKPDVRGVPSAVCVPRSNVCGTPVTSSDAGDGASAPLDAASEVCGHLVGPDLPGGCTSKCTTDGGADPCQTNGCFNGYWCDTDSLSCSVAPNGGSCGDNGPGVPYDGGAAVTGTVGADGGSLSRLLFAIIGDTRPATQDDTADYPTPIISRIFSDVQAASPRPPFAISTGDYVFASPDGGEAAAQLDLYLTARAAYTSAVFPAMGNHECTGATKSNCGATNVDGLTANYQVFLEKMLAPIGQTAPSYEIDVSALDSSWTAKFLFIPGNAWTSEVGTWLDAAMSRATTYTFVVRHEGTDAPTAPGVTPSLAIMAKHPYTLAVVGHDHIYAKTGPQEVTVGNGGAPPTGPSDYGYTVVSQRPDGVLDVDAIDYETGLADSSFHFAVEPDGSAAQ